MCPLRKMMGYRGAQQSPLVWQPPSREEAPVLRVRASTLQNVLLSWKGLFPLKPVGPTTSEQIEHVSATPLYVNLP